MSGFLDRSAVYRQKMSDLTDEVYADDRLNEREKAELLVSMGAGTAVAAAIYGGMMRAAYLDIMVGAYVETEKGLEK